MKTRDLVSDKLAQIEMAIRSFEEETGILITRIERRFDFFSGDYLLMENKVEFKNKDMVKINSQWPIREKPVPIPKTHTT